MADTPDRPHFDPNPLFRLAIAFAGGIAAGGFLDLGLTITVAAAAGLFALALVARQIYPAAARWMAVAAFVFAGAVALQVERAGVGPERIRTIYDEGTVSSGDPVEVEGVVSARPEPAVDGAFLTLRADKLKFRGRQQTVTGNVRLFLPAGRAAADPEEREAAPPIRYGSRVRIACALDRKDEYLNPGVLPRREVLDHMGIDATGTIKSRLMITRLADESVFIPLAWVYDRRAAIIDDMRRNLGQPAAGVMIASLLGNKYFLDKGTADLFREGGTFHILVISGLHITFIGAVLMMLMRWVTDRRWLQFAVAVPCLWAYSLAVGGDVPVVRAALMFTVISLSYVLYRTSTMLNSLGLSALLLLGWHPSEVFGPSFQLTFVSVAAIIVMALPLVDILRSIGRWMPTPATPFPPNVPDPLRRFCEMVYWDDDLWLHGSKRQIWSARLFKRPYLSHRVTGLRQTVVRYVFEATLVSFIVQLWMLPLLVVYFHRVSFASIVLNLWVGILIGLESFVVAAGLVFDSISSIAAAPLFLIAEVLNWLMLALPRLFSDNAWISFRLPAYTGAGRTVYVLYGLLVVGFAIILRQWKPFSPRSQLSGLMRRMLTAMLVMLVVLHAVIVFHPFSAPVPDGRLSVDFLDVGQGDSALVTFPDGRTLLIDGGGRVRFRIADPDDDRGIDHAFEPDIRGVGDAVVSEFLWERGYSRVDHILGTHADADHMQGLVDVANNFQIGSALFGRLPADDPEFAELTAVLERRNIPVETIGRGDRLEFGRVIVEILYPEASDDTEALSDNDHSVVVRIVYGARAFLLTGDVERRAEADILASRVELTADLVKVAHHGSRTSSTEPFVNSVSARHAVISVGRISPFGHPHQDVVARWSGAGAQVMTTGERGMITASTDGQDLVIETFLP